MSDKEFSEQQKEEQEFQEALDFVGKEEKQVRDDAFVTYKTEKDTTNKVTKLRDIAISYRMVLEGKSYDEEKGGFAQTGKSIAGQHFINLSFGILNSFASDANLLTQKNLETFHIQFIDAFEKIEGLTMRDRSIQETNHRAILKIFKDSLYNIGEIITGSAENMRAVFSKFTPQNDYVNDMGDTY